MRFSYLLTILIAVTNCSSHSQESNQAKITNNLNVKEELFNDFLKKFSKDSVFQNSRIKFPLLSESEDDSGKSEKNFIQQKDWGFSDLTKLRKPKYIQSVKEITKYEYHLILQVEDTGVYVIYVFKKDKNKWILSQIIDDSN
jgi:hypothetical protein